jgi:glycosyltransferase involved in cell wall biosynthesis
MKKVSVITIAKKEKELEPLKNVLRKQTFKGFEFVTSTKEGIPQAMNDAINKAKGEIIIVTESDALPLSNKWLEEMVKAVREHNKNDPEKRTIIRGVEVSPLPWCWCNFACYSSVLKNNKIDESYPFAEDTELFARLKKMGYIGLELPIAPVFHKRQSKGFWKPIKKSFTYGKLLTRITLQYGNVGFGSEKKESINIFEREIRIILSRISFLLGTAVGFVIYYFRRLEKTVFK